MLYFHILIRGIVEVCIAAIGAMYFLVRGFGCALFYLGMTLKMKKKRLYERSYWVLDDEFWSRENEKTNKTNFKAYLIYDTIAKVADERKVPKEKIANEIGISMNTVYNMKKGKISDKVYYSSRIFFNDKYGLKRLGALCRDDEATVIWVDSYGEIHTDRSVVVL